MWTCKQLLHTPGGLNGFCLKFWQEILGSSVALSNGETSWPRLLTEEEWGLEACREPDRPALGARCGIGGGAKMSPTNRRGGGGGGDFLVGVARVVIKFGIDRLDINEGWEVDRFGM